jgi:peroxiredoxin
MYYYINVIYTEVIFKTSKMRLLQIILALSLFSCQSTPSKESKEKNSETPQSVQSSNQVTNGIVFRDAQGKFLTDAEKDSIVQNLESVQALRRYDEENNNTEYILFQDYEDLRGFIGDTVIADLIEENELIRSGGRGAVISKRINDQWLDKPLPAGDLNMLDGSIKSFADFNGKMLVVNFWYINCGPCIAEMPFLNDLVDKYTNEDIQFLALSFDSKTDINNFLQRTEFKYEQGSISREFMYDFTPVSPGHFIVDREGIIRDILIGAPRETSLIFKRLISVIEKNKK